MIKCNMIKILTRRKYDKMLYDKLFDFFYHIYFFNMIKKKPMPHPHTKRSPARIMLIISYIQH